MPYNEGYIKAKLKQAEAHKLTGQQDIDHSDRLPPGQTLTTGFPILDLGVRPKREEYPSWQIEVRGKVANKKTFSLDEIKKLSREERMHDFHCVTRWSRYDINWAGMPFTKLLELIQPLPEAKHVVFYSYDNYTTNIPLEELRNDDVLIAYELEGKEIPPEHGGPVRMIVPMLYGWKSAKFLTKIEFRDEDESGFWEVRGYHNHGDPWLEERYS